MNLINFSVLLVSGLFGIYGVCAAIECGIVLKMAAKDQASRRMFTPLWELTNVLLVFGFTALAMLFNGALTTLSHALLTTLAAALFSLLLRACIVLTIFYIREDDILPVWLTYGLALGTFLVPLSFAAAGIYMLSGTDFWRSDLGIILMASTLVGLCATGLLYLNRKANRRQRLPGELLFDLWLLLLGFALPMTVVHTRTYLHQGPIAVLELLSAAGLGLMIWSFIRRPVIKLWYAAAIIGLLAPPLLAWADRPYLISGKLTLEQAWGAQSYGAAIVTGLIIMLPLILFGLYTFARLFSTTGRPTK